ncbi:helix-turn-helix domain-containing protein [Sinosporangium siamense]|uniref:HTH domain-containing protein n=1 Tax=Sinosporangium siamense TaxID=1367973 RepID=A0A919VAR0_9ACTN|nr:helix-turn-helix domain-containing protein [Sinosporangium siamense]GII91369.1 HTH domain-containing protein [Sinosporangium siamense]
MDDAQLSHLATLAQGEDPLAALRATAALHREAARLEAVQVRRARVQGRTWSEIAEALGISKQAVHKKYGGRGLFRSQD